MTRPPRAPADLSAEPDAYDPRRRRRSARAGFTLAEMMVVIGIILLVAILALPAFTAIIGGRSVESARNLVAASLVRARAEAIRRGQPCGVFFFLDPETNRTGAAVVTLDPLSDPERYDEYKSFYARRAGNGPFRDYQGGTHDPLRPHPNPLFNTGDILGEPYMTADRVLVVGQDVDPFYTTANGWSGNPRYEAFAGRPITLTMKHTSQAIDAAGTPNPGVLPAGGGDTAGVPFPVAGGGNAIQSTVPASAEPADRFDARWTVQGVDTIELIDGIDVALLPAGAALQVILDQTLEGTPETRVNGAVEGLGAPPNGRFLERYARFGLILFDAQGRLTQLPYRVDGSSRLARAMGIGPDSPGGAQNIPPNVLPAGVTLAYPTSQLGVVIYDAEAFEGAAADGTAVHWEGSAIASLNSALPDKVIDDFATTQADRWQPWRFFSDALGQGPPAAADEYAEERWLDANTIPLMVNRYSGTLVEAE